jgi:hypothetical protein
MLAPGARTWWPGVRMRGHLREGADLDLVVRSPWGYRLSVRLTLTEVVPGRRVRARGTGDLVGEGAAVLTGTGRGATVIDLSWRVSTQRRWMNATALALRPVFALGHAAVMRAGERGMRRAVRGARFGAPKT